MNHSDPMKDSNLVLRTSPSSSSRMLFRGITTYGSYLTEQLNYER